MPNLKPAVLEPSRQPGADGARTLAPWTSRVCSGALTIGLLVMLLGVAPQAAGRSAPDQLEAGASCVEGGCHEPITARPYIHWPELAEPGQCQRCHEPEDSEHAFETSDTAESCLACHETLADRLEAGGTRHEAMEDDCTECHDPHGGPEKTMLIDSDGEDLSSLCFNCHEEDILDGEVKHGPAALGACNMCHDPHVSKLERLLVAEGAELCTGCHEEIAEAIEQADFVHDPAEDDCIDCHNPHSGPYAMMTIAPKRGLCAECHDEIVDLSEAAAVRHAPTYQDEECLNCHDPHAANAEPMLKAPQRELCLQCHDEPVKAGDDWLIDMADWLEKNPVWHKPVVEDNCSGCHKPHGSKHFRLLKESFPKKFYSRFKATNYGLCFSCHESSMVMTKSTRSLTNFRDSDRNLHFLHVNRKKRGRSCRACHEVHASGNKLQVRDRVPYGRWMMPLNFKKTEDGGSCQPGCHDAVVYSRTAKSPSKGKAVAEAQRGEGQVAGGL